MSSEWNEARLLGNLYGQYGRKMVNAVVPHAPLGLAPNEVGYHEARTDGLDTIRFIDALVLFRQCRWAVECKVRLHDLRRELENPAKVALWRAHTHSFYYLVAPDLAATALSEVPTGFGVMVPAALGTAIIRRATSNPDPADLPYDTWRRIARRYGATKLAVA